jgi:nucleotide-binding universal stress UspA family protein
MKTIILATDFSPAALNAANYASGLGKAIGADLLLFHAFYLFVTYTDVPPLADPEELRENAQSSIDQLRKQLKDKYGNSLNIKTEVRMGTFVTQLESLCESIKPYAVVLGSQGSSATDYRFFGSQTVLAMKQLSWPVIAIPSSAKFTAVKKIALACDLENVLTHTPVHEIKNLVKDFNVELHILNTNKKKNFDPKMVAESGLLIRLFTPIQPEYHFITSENIDEGIINFCEMNRIDLLIVIPKRHNLLDKLIHKSHTKRLVLQSHTPIVALHE